MMFYPYKRKGGGGSFSHAKGGHTRFEVDLTQELEVLAIPFILKLGWGGGGAHQVLPCLEGWGEGKKFRTRDFPTLYPYLLTGP